MTVARSEDVIAKPKSQGNITTNNNVLHGFIRVPFGHGDCIATNKNGTFVSYVGADTATEGAWTGRYGSSGYLIPNGSSSATNDANVSFVQYFTYTWAGLTSDPRALQSSLGARTGIASAYVNYYGRASTSTSKCTTSNRTASLFTLFARLGRHISGRDNHDLRCQHRHGLRHRKLLGFPQRRIRNLGFAGQLYHQRDAYCRSQRGGQRHFLQLKGWEARLPANRQPRQMKYL